MRTFLPPRSRTHAEPLPPNPIPTSAASTFRWILRAVFVALIPVAQLAALELDPAELTLTITPAGDHRPVTLSVSGAPADPNGGDLQAHSDQGWVIPSVDATAGTITLEFATSHLTVLEPNATLFVNWGELSGTVSIHARLQPLQIVRLQDDPFRSHVYGAHQAEDGGPGAVIFFDPVNEHYLGHTTVGVRPSGMALSAGGAELFVVSGGSAEIHVVDLQSLTVSEVISLPEFETRDHPFVGNVATGPNNVLYYTDGAEPPRLRVYSRNTGDVIQTVTIAPGNNAGFGNFAVNPGRTHLFGWSQSNWGFTPRDALISRFSIGGAGTLTHREFQHLPQLLNNSVEPGESPVLLDRDGTTAVVRDEVLRTASLSEWVNTLPSPVYSMTPNARIAGAANGLYDIHTGERLVELHPTVTVQAFTSDFSRFVYFHRTSRSLRTLDLGTVLSDGQLGLTTTPADGETASLPVLLNWLPVPGAGEYHVYFGNSEQNVAAANPESPLFRGATHKNAWSQLPSLALDTTYFWRVDAVTVDGIVPGPTRSFTTAPIYVAPNVVRTEAFESATRHEVSIHLSHPFIRDPEDSPSVAWEGQSDRNWISLRESEGITPGPLVLELNAKLAGPGWHRGVVSVSANGGTPFRIPVELKVLPLQISRIATDPDSDRVYAISQFQQNRGHRAYLLELDSTEERIVRSRYIAPGVSGIAVHSHDNRIYLSASPGARVLTVNPANLETMNAFSLTGSSTSPPNIMGVYPGAAGRLIVGHTDPSYGIRVIDTTTGNTVTNAGSVRTGGGASAQNGLIYYHGESNSSGAHLRRYSLNADQFTEASSVRVTSVSNFGSPIVTISHDGSRLFWNGSVFSPNLAEEWEIGALIHSASADGRLAAGETLIYDIDQQEAVLGMPKDPGPSVFNATSGKFVVQTGNRLAFFDPEAPAALAAPELKIAARADTWIDLEWIDRSLETGFSLEMQANGDSSWSPVASPPQNATSFRVTGLNPQTDYRFRLRATSTSGNSEWSEAIDVMTSAPPPAAPGLNVTAQSAFAVLLRWNTSETYESAIVERRISPEDPWTHLRTIPAEVDRYLDEDNLLPGVLHHYRVFLERDGVLSEPSPARSARPDSFESLQRVQIANLIPDTPTSLTLTWERSPRAQWYTIEYRAAGAAEWTHAATVGREQNAYRHTGLDFGQTYEYRLRAGNELTTATPSDVVAATVAEWTALLREDFAEAPNPRNWARVLGGQVLEGMPGFDRGSALWFESETVSLEALSVDARNGGILSFDLRAGNTLDDGPDYWENFDSRNLDVSYSTDGHNWTLIERLDLGYPNFLRWDSVFLEVPPQARTAATRFRWRVATGGGQGNWAVANIRMLSESAAPPPAPAYVLAGLEAESQIRLRWPVPHPGGSATLSHPESLYQFRIERRLAGRVWQPIGTVTGGAEPSFVDVNAPAYGTVFYRVSTLRPWTESRPSLPVTVSLGTQLEAWRQTHYGSMENAGLAADLALDSFGLTNLTRYAFGLGTGSPAVTYSPCASIPGLPAIWIDPETGLVHVAFLRRKPSTHPEIEYLTEYSDDLNEWTEPAAPYAITAVNDLWEEVRFVQPASLGATPHIFARVKVRRINL